MPSIRWAVRRSTIRLEEAGRRVVVEVFGHGGELKRDMKNVFRPGFTTETWLRTGMEHQGRIVENAITEGSS